MQRFPECRDYSKKPSIEEVEELMRPFAPISWEVQGKITALFRENHNVGSTLVGQKQWWEANFVVSGNGPHHQEVVDLLCRDTCTCVIPYLPYALKHKDESTEVDERILEIMRSLGQL